MSPVDPKDDEVFEIGERTVYKMRNQPFVADDFGTMISRPPRAVVPVTVASEPTPEPPDRLTRLERKVDEILELLKSLEARLK